MASANWGTVKDVDEVLIGGDGHSFEGDTLLQVRRAVGPPWQRPGRAVGFRATVRLCRAHTL